MQCVHSACTVSIFHRPTHLFNRVVHVFQASKGVTSCAYCTVSLYVKCLIGGFLGFDLEEPLLT